MAQPEEIRRQIAGLVAEYHQAAFIPRPFVPGETPVRYAGRVFDAEELQLAVEACLDFWLTAGRFTEQFESTLAERMDRDTALLVNSGSSANLVAFSALTSPQLKDRRVRPATKSSPWPRASPRPSTPSSRTGPSPCLSTWNWPATCPRSRPSPQLSRPRPAP